MIGKVIKLGALTVGGTVLVGVLAFGADFASYMRSSARSVRIAVHDNVPIEFQLRRAHDLLDQIGPEMHDNIRAIAEQEVAVATLKREIAEGQTLAVQERDRVKQLRDAIVANQTTYTFGDLCFTHEQLTQELSRQFTHLKEAQTALSAKRELLDAREKSLAAAEQALENAKAQRATLAAQIEGLEAQYQLVQAASATSDNPVQFDHSKVAQAKKAIEDVRRELAVSERVLAHEAHFTAIVPPEAVSEKDLLSQVDAQIAAPAGTNATDPQASAGK